MIIQPNQKKETDFYIREWNPYNPLEGDKITFKYIPRDYQRQDYDWYIIVALEKADKVTKDRHLLTSELIINYRNAIREGYQHSLDPHLVNRYDYPRNHNTIKGITGYIAKMLKPIKDE